MPARRGLLRPVGRVAAGLGVGIAVTGCAVTVPEAHVDPGADTQRAAAGPTSDGTFSGTGSYETPGGRQDIEVTVVLADGVVTALRVDPAATNTTSRRFQERFASAVVDDVVGRPLSEVAVDRVAGSSATGSGFMAALDQLARDAVAGQDPGASEGCAPDATGSC